jgi:hypothetical protein
MMTQRELAHLKLSDTNVQVGRSLQRLDAGDLDQALHALDLAHWGAGGAMGYLVEMMRERGDTWQQIGDVLGITRQAAWGRFGK